LKKGWLLFTNFVVFRQKEKAVRIKENYDQTQRV